MSSENLEMNNARQHYHNTKDASATIEMIPKYKRNSVEMCLLRGLERYKNDNNLLAAINYVSIYVCTCTCMYVHVCMYMYVCTCTYVLHVHTVEPL